MKNVVIINKIMSEVDRIVKATETEYKNFKAFQLTRDAKTLFENAYRISCMNDLYYFFNNSGFSDMINNNISLYEEFFGSDSNLDSQVIESKLEDWLLKVDNLVTTSFPSLENYLSFPILLYVLNYLGEYLVRGVRKHA